MKNIIKKGLIALGTVVLMSACAEYTDFNYPCEPDPDFKEPYKDYEPIKSYIDHAKYPNLKLVATLKVADFNLQQLEHAAAVTNFDELAFGTSMMPGEVYDNDLGMFDFIPVRDLLDHVEELGVNVFGSALASNANQADTWLNKLTAPIEIVVPFIEDIEVDFTTLDKFTGKQESKTGSAELVIPAGETTQCLETKGQVSVNLIEDLDVDPSLEYTITFTAKTTKKEGTGLPITFAGKKLTDKERPTITTDWNTFTIKVKPAEGTTKGNFLIEQGRNMAKESIYFQMISVGHYPDNHRVQTEQELSDTIKYALNTWCDGLMKVNKGRIKSFDLIEDAIDTDSVMDNGMFSLKHSEDITKAVYWQDMLGNEQYAPAVAKAAREAYEKYEGDLSQLKLFISESDLDNPQKLQSMLYWIGVWEANGAKIDGISAKLSINYFENADEQKAKHEAVETMLKKLAETGKYVRISNFDIGYVKEDGIAIAAGQTTDVERQKIADYYAEIIKNYMTIIPSDKQAGICKGNLVDTNYPVGLWSKDSKGDWVRTATYKAFCDVLSGK